MCSVCRFCGKPLTKTFVDLGMTPLSNSYIKKENLLKPEMYYPLYVYVCESCFLVQLEQFEIPEKIFSDYAYFSSYSRSWLQHAKIYAKKVISEFNLHSQSQVVEIASNDGYLLQYFVEQGIPSLGIEPAHNVAEKAIKKGINTRMCFFNKGVAETLVKEGLQADLLIGNNVLAHVPNLNDFVEGLKILLKPSGIITMEFPHLMRLMQQNQFDTIYHEHFSYFSLITILKIFKKHGLCVFNVEELSTHGGSIRVYAKHQYNQSIPISNNVDKLIMIEKSYKLDSIEVYKSFSEKIQEFKKSILEIFINIKKQNKKIVGYGAPAKGNTLLNFCGIGTDFIDYTVDRNPYKQGLYLPGTHIPIFSVDKIEETKPDYVVILPWNLKDEVINQMSIIKNWGGRFILLIPEIEIV